jgi:hypothetical protein
MRKLYVLFGLVLMVALVWALIEGQELNQQQLDLINPNTENLDCKYENIHEDNGYIIIDISCLEVIPNGNDFIVKRKAYGYFYPKTSLEQCLDVNSLQTCADIVKNAFIQANLNSTNQIRTDIGNNQSSSSINSLDLNLFVPTNQQLNTTSVDVNVPPPSP